MNRRTLLLLSCLAVAVLSFVATPRLLYYHRKSQLNAARDLVAAHGGSFGLDLVDGNYMLDLHGEASTDETLQAILPTLKALPNGFTLIGPGESRLFYVSLRDSRIRYACYPVLDAGTTDAVELASFAQALLPPDDGKLLIHCANGHGRTGMFAAIWLLAQPSTMFDATETAARRSCDVSPNCSSRANSAVSLYTASTRSSASSKARNFF